MSKMVIEVKFLHGTNLKEAIAEAKRKAFEWNVCINFNFNDEDIYVYPGRRNIEDIYNEYSRVLVENMNVNLRK